MSSKPTKYDVIQDDRTLDEVPQPEASVDMNGQDLINVGSVDGVDISAHVAASTLVHGIADTSALTLTDGSRPFTAVVGGVTPTLPAHLATKQYVDASGGGGYWTQLTGVLSPTTLTDKVGIGQNTASEMLDVLGNIAVSGTVDGLDISTHDHSSGSGAQVDHVDLASIGSNTHAQIDTHIASVLNPHAVTKTQVSLGNVTDDAQLKRSNGDFNTFTLKATPIGTDIILIEDSADTNNKKKILISSLPGSGSGVDSFNTRTGAVVSVVNDYTWAQIDKTVSSIADIATRSHTALTDIGSNTHAQIDTHVADATIHFTKASISHADLANLTADDHTQYILVDGTRAFTGVVSGVTPTLTAHLATKGYVDGLVQGISWQEPVKAIYDPTPNLPLGPSTGDRYISSATANGWTINNIYEYNGASWDATVPTEGYAVWVEDIDKQYMFNGTTWVIFGATVDHGNLIGLGDDDHSQYLNVARHDLTARHTLGTVVPHDDHSNILNVTANQHHNQVHELNGTDHVITGGTLDWAKVNKTGSSLTDIDSRSHTALTDIGTNTHAQLDTHVADATIHFLVGSISHTAITNIGTNTHAQIDTHIADGTIHFTEASIDHTAILNIGTNSHAVIDTHIASVLNPHTVTKTQVSLGNVTDDAQLKRSAGDFDTFTSKATPIGADILLIEDSADTNNKKKILLSSLPTAGVTSFNTRTGAVVATANDYTWAQIDKTTSDIANITTRSHASLQNLTADDHTQYILATGTRAFTGVVSGITPTATAHLSTKGYVDGLIPTTTKGDLIVYGTANTRLPVGTNGDVLVADSAEALGVKWETVSAGILTTETAESLGLSSTTSTTYVTKLSFVTSVLPAGVYRVGMSCQHNTSKASVVVYANLVIDSVQEQEFSTLNTGLTYQSTNSFAYKTFTAGAHTILIQQRTDTGTGGGSNIKDARLELWRVS